MRSADRPISPHLQIYRWQLTSVLSILHRAAGVALSIRRDPAGVVARRRRFGPEAYDSCRGAFSVPGSASLLLLGWSVALFYHLCNGIRHLVWDTGHAARPQIAPISADGWSLGGTAVLTLIAWGRR